MFEAVGHAVSRLIRIRYGAMVLPRGLKRGAWMELDEGDLRALTRAAGGERRSDAGEGGERPGGGDRPGRSGRGNSNNRRRGPGGPPAGEQPRRGNGKAGPGGAPGGRKAPQQQRDRDERGGAAQPDPMKTAFGYIGADSFTRQRPGAGPRRGPGGGNGGGGGGGFGGGSRRGGGGGRGR